MTSSYLWSLLLPKGILQQQVHFFKWKVFYWLGDKVRNAYVSTSLKTWLAMSVTRHLYLVGWNVANFLCGLCTRDKPYKLFYHDVQLMSVFFFLPPHRENLEW